MHIGLTQHNIRLSLADLGSELSCAVSSRSYKERSQSRRSLFCCQAGMVRTGEGSVIFSSAFRFIFRFALAYRKCAAAHLRYLGCKQRFREAVNDRIGIEPTT